jgi:pimeloyl-ACP methyl ester carboxylesterase
MARDAVRISEGAGMPTVQGNGIDIYYEVQGEGEPLVLIPYLAADQACYAFQVAEYAKHFTCFTVDLRGAGLSGKPEGTYTTELFADDVAAFMHAAGIERAHVAGLSLGGATGMWLAAKQPELVKSLSLHSSWPASDAFLRQSGAVLTHDAQQALGSIQAPTLITFGGRDMVTSTRFAGPLTGGIAGSELIVFEDCAHAPIYEDVDGFNAQTLAFLQRHAG